MTTPASLIAGRYRLDVALATGGMGVVWRGWDERLERAVAIKQLRLQPGLSASDSAAARERALREARITARLHHPNAVPIYDVVEHDGEPCLIMQYLPSVSLQTTLQRRGSLPLLDVARIGSEIASALTAAHRVGIVHRDVKPGNVLIAADGAAKLTDFGISHAMGDVSLTSTDLVTGTPAYLAPEVARGEPATFASDVFSLGATLYTASEGMPPFEPADNPMALLHRVAAGHVRPPTRSGALTPLLTRMLAADPRARPSMTEAWVDLTSLHASSAINGLADLATTQLPPLPPTQHPDAVAAAATRRSTTSLEAGRSSPALPAPAAIPPLTPAQASHPPPATPLGRRAGAGNRRSGRAVGIVTALVALAAVVIALVYFVPKLGQGSHQPGGSGISSKTRPATKAGAPRANVSSPTPTAKSTTAQPTTPAPTTSAPTTSAPATGSATPSKKPSTTPSATAGTTTADTATTTATKAATTSTSAQNSTEPTSGGTAGSDRLAGAVTGYYALVPDNLDAGYARLTPAYQRNHAGGYAGYQKFWRRMSGVSTTNVDGQAPDAATATITYHYKNGRTVVERTRYHFVRTGGRLLIADSAVLSSRSG